MEPLLYKTAKTICFIEPLIILHLLGASQESAERVFTVLSTKHYLSGIELKWWRELPPDFDGKHGDKGEWVGYNSRRGFYEIPQKNDIHFHNVFMLYYSDGPDPARLLEEAFEEGVLATDPSHLIIPVSEFILDRQSCYNITSSERAPLLRVKVGWRTYCAPYTVRHLGELPTGEFYQRGEDKSILGELGWRLK